MQELNTTLSTEYGLPTWLCYGLFAAGTIILGAVVGLVLVCIIDFIWPQKPAQRQSFSQVQEKEKQIKRKEEVINEDLEDDRNPNEDDDDDDDTSEAERNSGSDEEEEEEEAKPSPKASPDVRKRRTTRKAD